MLRELAEISWSAGNLTTLGHGTSVSEVSQEHSLDSLIGRVLRLHCFFTTMMKKTRPRWGSYSSVAAPSCQRRAWIARCPCTGFVSSLDAWRLRLRVES